ncbi:DUF6084 family protein [Spongiactinospora sp. TRM90649]|uniref:DUF6084 family protein n=1 Tax=Spongiactinospora sp. TRM90649 TaxID=3031114 RepID=UPI0023F7F8DA|nr:DUF6084 family protein [Spongiactinospora sp. TRM90649]MDF5751747.1 DUF6084 family protein [Spongiactinospora sp. TRM90649]
MISPQVRIEVEGVEPAAATAVPALDFTLAVRVGDGAEVRSLALAVQIRIDATRRGYDDRDRERLVALFGVPGDWSRNLSSLLWAQAAVQVPGFIGETRVVLTVPCTYDLEVAAAKFFHGLRDGDAPLDFLFTGTLFYADGGRLQVAHLPRDTDAEFRMPVQVWRELMDRQDNAWVRLSRDAFDRLYAYKVRHTLTGWDDVVRALLAEG